MSQCKHGTTETSEKVCRICSESRVAELEQDLIRERVRIYEATRQHWHGEMGPAWIYVNDLHATLNP